MKAEGPGPASMDPACRFPGMPAGRGLNLGGRRRLLPPARSAMPLRCQPCLPLVGDAVLFGTLLPGGLDLTQGVDG